VHVDPVRLHAAVFGLADLRWRPPVLRRHLYGLRMDACLHARNEIALPAQALDLPDAQRAEEQHSEHEQRKQAAPLASIRRHCIWLIEPPGMPGIMLELRWIMIHSEPVMMMSTSTAVKTYATRVQPPCTRVFR